MSTKNPRSRALLVVGAVSICWAGLSVPAASPAVAAPGDFTVAPTTLSFPDTFVGDTAEQVVTITNVSATTQTPNFSGGAPLDAENFGGSQNCAGVPLAPGATCQFTYTFEPASSGPHSSSTTIGIDTDNFQMSMSGQGLSPISVAPTTLTFPDTAIGSTSSIAVVVTNISPVSQTPNYAGGAPLDPTNFGGSQNCAGVTLGAGASCQFTYEFTPSSMGPLSSSTTIEIDGVSFAISLSGTGVDPSATTTTSTTTPDTSTSTSSPTTTDATTTVPSDSSTTTSSTTPSTVVPGLPGPGTGPVATGHAAVIAQGIVDFPDGPFRWDVQRLGAAWPFTFDASPPVFVIAQGPDGIVVQGSTDTLALLEDGEATFVAPGSSGSIRPRFDGATAEADRVTFVSGGSGSFVPGAGPRDVNVIRDVLEPGETVSVTSLFPLLVIPDGTFTVVGAAVSSLPDGVATTLGPSVELRNDGTAPASVVIAAVGDSLAPPA